MEHSASGEIKDRAACGARMKMKLTANIYELDGEANDTKVGEIQFDGERITTSNSKSLLLTRMASVPIEVKGKVIDPDKEPERFVRNLWQHYHSPYLRAMKARIARDDHRKRSSN